MHRANWLFYGYSPEPKSMRHLRSKKTCLLARRHRHDVVTQRLGPRRRAVRGKGGVRRGREGVYIQNIPGTASRAWRSSCRGKQPHPIATRLRPSHPVARNRSGRPRGPDRLFKVLRLFRGILVVKGRGDCAWSPNSRVLVLSGDADAKTER